jgi:hypothetical protein
MPVTRLPVPLLGTRVLSSSRQPFCRMAQGCVGCETRAKRTRVFCLVGSDHNAALTAHITLCLRLRRFDVELVIVVCFLLRMMQLRRSQVSPKEQEYTPGALSFSSIIYPVLHRPVAETDLAGTWQAVTQPEAQDRPSQARAERPRIHLFRVVHWSTGVDRINTGLHSQRVLS